MFSRQSSSNSTEGSQSHEQEIYWKDLFLDVETATVHPDTDPDERRRSFYLKLALTRKTSQSSTSIGNEPESYLVFPVEEKDAPTFLRLLGKRVLLTRRISRAALERDQLQSEVQRLTRELNEALQREEHLRTNFHQLVEGSRRIP